jgi:hypothetical protein
MTNIHSTRVFNSIADTGAFSETDIMKLLVEGGVELEEELMLEFSFVDLLNLSGKDKELAISLLVYLGVLSYSDEPQMLQIPNEVSKTLVWFPSC